jgi:hypothetical protein
LTLIRHFLARDVVALARCMVPPPTERLLVTSVRRPAARTTPVLPAGVAAVDLAAIAASADVEHGLAALAAGFTETLVGVHVHGDA